MEVLPTTKTEPKTPESLQIELMAVDVDIKKQQVEYLKAQTRKENADALTIEIQNGGPCS